MDTDLEARDRAQRQRTLLAAVATAVLFFVGVVSLAFVDEDKTLTTVGLDAGSSSTTSTTVATIDETTTTTVDMGASTTTVKAGSTATTAKATTGGSTGGAATGPINPGPSQITKPGTYRYRSVRNTGEGDQTQEIDYKVANTAKRADGQEQSHTVEQEEGKEVNVISWRADGQYLESSTFGGGGFEAKCTWKPAILVNKSDLAKGVSWTTDSLCDLDFGPAKGTARRQATTTVGDAGRATVGGESIDVWNMHTSATITVDVASPQGSVKSVQKEESDEQYAPSVGLSVKNTAKGTATTNGKSQNMSREMNLLSLKAS